MEMAEEEDANMGGAMRGDGGGGGGGGGGFFKQMGSAFVGGSKAKKSRMNDGLSD